MITIIRNTALDSPFSYSIKMNAGNPNANLHKKFVRLLHQEFLPRSPLTMVPSSSSEFLETCLLSSNIIARRKGRTERVCVYVCVNGQSPWKGLIIVVWCLLVVVVAAVIVVVFYTNIPIFGPGLGSLAYILHETSP